MLCLYENYLKMQSRFISKYRMQFSWRRGVVDVDTTQTPRRATKKTSDKSRFAMIHKETEIIKKLNDHKIRFVPQYIDQGEWRFSYFWIPWERFDKIYASATKRQKQQLNNELLDKAFQLDTLWIVHGELDNPMSNILVDETRLRIKKPCISIIDFERGHRNDTSWKNCKHVMQWLQRQWFVSIEQCKQRWQQECKILYAHLKDAIAMKNTPTNKVMSLMLIIFFIVIDLITKRVFYDLKRWEHYLLITPMLNTGIGRSIPFSLSVLIPVSIGIICTMFRWIRQQKKTEYRTVLFAAGAMGNLIDRIVYQWVRDFIDFHYRPVFNVADLYLTCSICILFYLVIIQQNNGNH